MPKYQVYYMRPEWFGRGIMGERPSIAELDKTHILLKEVDAPSLERVYALMQGEIWSPNGEAMPLILSKGLQHTSMSVGDVVQLQDQVWVVAAVGFDQLRA